MTHSDTAPVGELLDRYLIGLDDGAHTDAAWFRSLFVADATVEFPHARHEGLDGMAEWHTGALSKFASTQHLGSPAVVDVAGEKATLRANTIATHVHRAEHAARVGPVFASGSGVTGEAQLTAAGWRLRRLTFRTLWSTGTPPPKD